MSKKKNLVFLEVSDEEEFRDWAVKIQNEFYDETVETLTYEEVEEETVFFVELEGKKYLTFYVVGEAKPSDKTKSINQKHREILKKVVKGKTVGELLYSVKNERD